MKENKDEIYHTMNDRFWKYAKKPIIFFVGAVIVMVLSLLWLPLLFMLPLFIFGSLVAWLSWEDIQEIKYGTHEPKHMMKWEAHSVDLQSKIKEQKAKLDKLQKAAEDTKILEKYETTIKSLENEIEILNIELEKYKNDLENTQKNTSGVVVKKKEEKKDNEIDPDNLEQ